MSYCKKHSCDYSQSIENECPFCENELKKNMDDAIAWGAFYMHGILEDGRE